MLAVERFAGCVGYSDDRPPAARSAAPAGGSNSTSRTNPGTLAPHDRRARHAYPHIDLERRNDASRSSDSWWPRGLHRRHHQRRHQRHRPPGARAPRHPRACASCLTRQCIGQGDPRSPAQRGGNSLTPVATAVQRPTRRRLLVTPRPPDPAGRAEALGARPVGELGTPRWIVPNHRPKVLGLPRHDTRRPRGAHGWLRAGSHSIRTTANQAVAPSAVTFGRSMAASVGCWRSRRAAVLAALRSRRACWCARPARGAAGGRRS